MYSTHKRKELFHIQPHQEQTTDPYPAPPEAKNSSISSSTRSKELLNIQLHQKQRTSQYPPPPEAKNFSITSTSRRKVLINANSASTLWSKELLHVATPAGAKDSNQRHTKHMGAYSKRRCQSRCVHYNLAVESCWVITVISQFALAWRI